MFRSPSHFAAHHYGQPDDLSLIASSAATTRAAANALARGETDLSRRLWQAVVADDLLSMWDRWNASSTVVGPRWDPLPPRPLGPKTSNPRPKQCKLIYERDQYRCRYCEIDVFTRWPGDPIAQLVAAFPWLTPQMSVVNGALTGTGRSGALRNCDYAKVLWTMAAPDHVFPRSLGGPTTEGNLVTACWGCNAWKGELTLEQIGVEPLRSLPG